jgi:hypothetical protein
MRKITILFILLSNFSFTQHDTTIVVNRDNIPLQAVLDIDGFRTLFVGQEYRINLTTSGNYPIKITATNAYVEFLESSTKRTGGLVYKLTPKDTGECKIAIYNVINESRTVNLTLNTYQVIKSPRPTIKLNQFESGQIINKIDDKVELTCSYPKETGIFDKFEIISWKLLINDKKFEGKGNTLTNEVLDFVKNNNDIFLHVQVNLGENKSGYISSESIYLVRK